ncbi:hypothetical protein A1Q2_08368 [Trichosporon asahii var. asahii CBS 8904]|uniref:Uncharacterized protein n=1 Tax=Trichosporon asahii var. asahii (strain CBS 8904) TaxID=1220162 RepID=K1VE58_TRIAC|nr:hypothetical protein A1Q2_08368 [Trichosporon asahii var. asahii CBS 8904]
MCEPSRELCQAVRHVSAIARPRFSKVVLGLVTLSACSPPADPISPAREVLAYLLRSYATTLNGSLVYNLLVDLAPKHGGGEHLFWDEVYAALG